MASLTDAQYLERLDAAVKLRRQGFLQIALEVTRSLLPEREKEPAVWHTLGQIQTDLGRFDSALRYHQTAAQLIQEHGDLNNGERFSTYQTIALGLACALLRHGQFEAGWPYWEAGRLGLSWTPWPGSLIWDGKPTDSLLVQFEGGYGDLFQFMRWLPLVKQRSLTSQLALMIQPRLADFCDWNALGIDQTYRVGVDQIPFGKWKCATSILSLPGLLGIKTWEDVPPVVFPPLWSPPIAAPVESDAFRIGLCWRAEENAAPVRVRSLSLEQASGIALSLTQQAEAQLLSLCIDAPLYKNLEGGSMSQPYCLLCEPECQASWSATAEYMCSLDFILTVDTAVAHLAGLLGIPTLVLLPVASEWRWGMSDRISGPWYGPQLTYYRQRKPFCWEPDAIVEATLARLKGLR